MNVEAAGRIREAGAALVRPVAPLPRPTRRNLLFDTLLALVLAVTATVYALSAGVGRSYLLVEGVERARTGADTWPGAVVPVTLPLALHRRFPLAVLWVVVGAGILAPDGEARIVFYLRGWNDIKRRLGFRVFGVAVGAPPRPARFWRPCATTSARSRTSPTCTPPPTSSA
ncbi:hypothetical protein [Streptomyces sp. NPDC048252]|uniref:hypothetical protein n=1 Tax=Streptomyces sp. NPDC048252 TaxID=3154612 RepID=UPI003431230F